MTTFSVDFTYCITGGDNNIMIEDAHTVEEACAKVRDWAGELILITRVERPVPSRTYLKSLK